MLQGDPDMMHRLRPLIAALLIAAGAAAAQTGDAAWPDRPIRLIVPFPAGSSTDIIARILGAEARRPARPAGRGREPRRRERQYRRRCDRQGRARRLHDRHRHREHARGRASASAPTCPTIRSRISRRSAMIGSQPYVLVVYPGPAGAATSRELIALAKAKPGTLNYGSAGVGEPRASRRPRCSPAWPASNITHVPYKSSAQSVTDMITGRLDMQFATIAPSLPNIRAGQLRALATSGSKRVDGAAGRADRRRSRHCRLRGRVVGRAS